MHLNSKKTVLFIDPPLYKQPFWDPIRYAQPLGIWSLASHLESRGHRVELISAPGEGWNRQRLVQDPLQDGIELSSYQQFKSRYLTATASSKRTLEKFNHDPNTFAYIGLTFPEIAERVRSINPDFIAISLIASCSHQSVIDLARYLKEQDCDIPIIVGGQHPTAMPEQVLRDADGAIDWVVRGEAEIILAAMVESDNNDEIRQIPGVCYLDSETGFVKNKRPKFFNLADIALPSVDVLDRIIMPVTASHTLDTSGRRYVDMMFSVGCHNTCAYCFSPQMRGGLRKLPETKVREMLETLWAHGYREIILQDDDLLYNRSGFFRLLSMFKEYGFHWQDNGGIELELLDEELIRAIAESNCTGLYVPVNPRKIADRFPTADALLKAHLLHLLKDYGIYTYTSGIYGVPNVSSKWNVLDDIRKLRDFHLDMLERSYVDASLVFPLSALPGTKWYHEIRRHPEFNFDESHWLNYSIFVPQLWPKGIDRIVFEAELVETHRQLNTLQTSCPWFSPFPNSWQHQAKGVKYA